MFFKLIFLKTVKTNLFFIQPTIPTVISKGLIASMLRYTANAFQTLSGLCATIVQYTVIYILISDQWRTSCFNTIFHREILKVYWKCCCIKKIDSGIHCTTLLKQLELSWFNYKFLTVLLYLYSLIPSWNYYS